MLIKLTLILRRVYNFLPQSSNLSTNIYLVSLNMDKALTVRDNTNNNNSTNNNP